MTNTTSFEDGLVAAAERAVIDPDSSTLELIGSIKSVIGVAEALDNRMTALIHRVVELEQQLEAARDIETCS